MIVDLPLRETINGTKRQRCILWSFPIHRYCTLCYGKPEGSRVIEIARCFGYIIGYWTSDCLWRRRKRSCRNKKSSFLPWSPLQFLYCWCLLVVLWFLLNIDVANLLRYNLWRRISERSLISCGQNVEELLRQWIYAFTVRVKGVVREMFILWIE